MTESRRTIKKAEPKAGPKASIRFVRKSQLWKVVAAGKTNAYGIGSRVPKGSCAYMEERGAWTAKTLEDAEQMAKDFATNMTAAVNTPLED